MRPSRKKLPSLMGELPILLVRATILVLPTLLLALVSFRRGQMGEPSLLLWLGTAFEACVCFLSFFSRGTWRQPLGPSLITLYLVGLAWLWFGDKHEDWLSQLSKSFLLIVPLIVFGFQTLYESGAPAIRRANLLAKRIRDRRDWPAELAACRTMPEVKALRAALGIDASPALSLFSDPRAEVRVAALGALEFRKEWRPGQAELVLQVGQRAENPAVRAAAIYALGNIDERGLVETLAQFMLDTSLEVRKAAVEALLWDCEHRWNWIRYTVRRIMADPIFMNDGPLLPDGQTLSDEAVSDLTAWCAEKGVLSARSAQTLAAHYHRSLTESNDRALYQTLRSLLVNVHTPAILRLELGRLLQMFQELDPQLLEALLDHANSAPLRLIACESILNSATNAESSLHPRAINTLKDLARLPNREIALATADVVQRRLGVDLGMGIGQPLPAVHSRQAADITRRVMQWAIQFNDDENLEDSRPNRNRVMR
jgi:HEAT repeats